MKIQRLPILISMALLIPGYGLANVQECMAKKSLLQNLFESKQAIDETLEKMAKSSEHKVIAFGEDHKPRIRNTYKLLFAKTKQFNNDYNCVAIEHNDEMQKHLDPWNSKSNIDTESQEFKAMLNELSGVSSIVEAGYQAGLKVFVIDNSPVLTPTAEGEATNSPTMNDRDIYMAEAIRKLFNSDRCKKSIAVVGAEHISSQVNLGRKNLSENLTGAGIKNHRVLLVDAGTAILSNKTITYPNYWFWSETLAASGKSKLVCPQSPGTLYQNFALTPRDNELGKGVTIHFNKKAEDRGGFWADLDAAFVFGCARSDGSECKKNLKSKTEYHVNGYLAAE